MFKTATAIMQLEDFIDKSFCSAFQRSNFSEPTIISTPFQQDPEGNLGMLETQFLTFKRIVEEQIQSLLHKLTEQHNIIDMSKQELCKLNEESLHLKSRISDLEGEWSSINTLNSSSSLYSEMVKENVIPTKNTKVDVGVTSSDFLLETTVQVDDSITITGCSPENVDSKNKTVALSRKQATKSDRKSLQPLETMSSVDRS